MTPKKEVNSTGLCLICQTREIHYRIFNNMYMYWCNTCAKQIYNNDIKSEIIK